VVAERRPVSSEIIATAEVTPPDDGVARVGAKASGRLTKLAVGVGDKVKKGQLIALINSPELGRAKADYLAAAVAARVGRETADQEKALLDKKISSERDYRRAEADASMARAEKEAAEARLHSLGVSDSALGRLSADQHSSSTISVSAPIEGVVIERPPTLGQTVDPQDTIATIMDLRTVWMQVDVYERDLAQLAVGHAVSAKVAAWPERAFLGTIESIGAVVDRRSRTVQVRVVVDNADGALKPGMFARVTLAGSTGAPREGLFVPASAIQRDGDGAIVFVPIGEHEFQLREVELGVTTAEWVEIVRGIVAGERVVATGTFQLKSEARRESFGGHEH
jgi:cobalt-zinc-cadmium efflux system membrane fusion protein